MKLKDMTIEQLFTLRGIRTGCIEEVLSRFESLRKENDELRKDKVRLDWINERKEWNFDINKASYDPCLSRLQIRDAVDAAMAKENEASHE